MSSHGQAGCPAKPPSGEWRKAPVRAAGSLFDTVVRENLCVGCGICAGISGDRTVVMHERPEGRYEPRIADPGDVSSWNRIAVRICPFADHGVTEDDLARELYASHPSAGYCNGTGYFLRCRAGYVREGEVRSEATSGGIVRWVLKELLARGLVDTVLCVCRQGEGGPLFAYDAISTVGDLDRCAKSAYYPVEMSGLVARMLAQDARYAVVGLPCFIKGLRLLARHQPVIAARVPYMIGLICGHLKTKQYLSYLARCAGVHESQVVGADFRAKCAGGSANDYAFEAHVRRNGQLGTCRIPVDDVYLGNWGYGVFKLPACDCCDDVFAETADMVVGDAWLPEYAGDHRGTSIVVTRSQPLDDLLEEGRKAGRLHLEDISAERARESQAGGLRHRSQGLAYRLHLAGRRGRHRPVKRVAPACDLPLRDKIKYRIRMHLAESSARCFMRCHSRPGVGWLHRRLCVLVAGHDLAVQGARGLRRLSPLIKPLLPTFVKRWLSRSSVKVAAAGGRNQAEAQIPPTCQEGVRDGLGISRDS